MHPQEIRDALWASLFVVAVAVVWIAIFVLCLAGVAVVGWAWRAL